MSKSLPPRAVVVTRPSDYELLLLRHGTREQARFFLETRGQRLDEVWARHQTFEQALHRVQGAIPLTWRRARVQRAEMDRFLFEPEDVVVAVGQDGLVANVAKYTHGQPVIGVNPSRDLFPGVLVRHPPEAVADLFAMSARGDLKVEERSMVEASLPDGQRLVALNEVFVGHHSHQSARYQIRLGDVRERQSSSGLIVATGTGATGWAKSLSMLRRQCPMLPTPTSRALIFLVREAWPSQTTGTNLVHGLLDTDSAGLEVSSEMNEGGVCFGDGIEDDHLDLGYGQVVSIKRAAQALRLAA